MSVRLTKLSVSGFGSLRDTEVDLGPITVLVGPNDAGKTTLLRAVELLARVADLEGGWRAFAEGQVSDFEFGQTATSLSLSGTIDSAPFDYSLRYGREGDDRGDVLETFTAAGGGIEQAVQVDLRSRYVRPQEKGHTTLLQGMETAEIRAVRQFLHGLLRYDLIPSRLRSPVPITVELRGEPFDPDGYGLAAAVADLLLRRGRVDIIEARLRKAIPTFGQLRSERLTYGDKSWFALQFETSAGELFDAGWASDGLLYLLAYFVLVESGQGRGLLMLEEPENGLHPGSLARLIGHLRQLANGELSDNPPQILMTTQSPLLVNELEPDEIRVVTRRDSGGTVARPFTSVSGLGELLEFQGPGEVWVNLGEEQLFGESAPREAEPE